MHGKENDGFIEAELGGDIPEIDLHGMDFESAKNSLESFMHNAFMNSDRFIRVMHGRGAGILSAELGNWLDVHGLVEAWRPSGQPNEVGAVTLVRIIVRR